MYSTIDCPKCNKPMKLLFESSPVAKKYEDCARRCEGCMVGASNAKTKPTFIYKNYKDNIPIELHEGIDHVMTNSINETAKTNKPIRLGFSTSEDTLTWIFFSYFAKKSELAILQNILALKNQIEEILLWGVPIINIQQYDYVNTLKRACLKFRENVDRLSEPDCIVITKTEVMFIEVKLFSENPRLKDKDLNKFDKYFANESYSDYSKAISSRLYELVRNWTIGNEFANGKKFYLMNLGRPGLFSKNKKIHLDLFKESLTDPSSFICTSWKSIIDSKEFLSLDPWFVDEIQKRFSK